MKAVRTTPGYHRLTLEGGVTLSGVATVLNESDAAAAEKVAAKHGIKLLLEDAPEGAASGDQVAGDVDQGATSVAVPDLAGGSSFVAGRGEPVTSSDVDTDDAGDDADADTTDA